MPEAPRPVHPTADQNGEHSPVGPARDPTAGVGDSGEKATEAAQDVDMADARPDGKSGVEAPGHSGNSAGSNTVASRDVHASKPQDDSAAVTNRRFLKQWVQACSPMMELTQLFLQYVSQEPEPDGFVPDAVLHKTRLCTRKIKPGRSDLRLMCKHARHQNQARQEGAAKTDFNGPNFPQQAAAAGTLQAADAELPPPTAAQQTGTHPQKSISSPKPAQARQTRSLAAATHTAAETAAASAQEAAPAPAAAAAAAAPVEPAAAAASQPPQAAAAENADEKSASAGSSGVAEAPESLAVPQKRGRAKGRKAGTAAAAAGDGQAVKAVVLEAGQPAVQPSIGAPDEAVSPAPPCTFASVAIVRRSR